jgi:RNA polymerase sigma-70 factor (ECF subfamily)
VNACLDRLRRAKVRSADPLPEDVEERATLDAVTGGGSTGDPEALALAGDRRQRVLAALDELHPDQKAALVLVDMEGYPVQEAALILEVPTGTVKSRCARGRARLAVLLADLDTGAEDGTAKGPAASYSGDPPRGARPTADPPAPTEPPGGRDQTHQHADPRGGERT